MSEKLAEIKAEHECWSGCIVCRLVAEVERLEGERGCLLAGPGRGDCDHFVGLSETEDEATVDEYGRPHGWCQICWCGVQIQRLHAARAAAFAEAAGVARELGKTFTTSYFRRDTAQQITAAIEAKAKETD